MSTYRNLSRSPARSRSRSPLPPSRQRLRSTSSSSSLPPFRRRLRIMSSSSATSASSSSSSSTFNELTSGTDNTMQMGGVFHPFYGIRGNHKQCQMYFLASEPEVCFFKKRFFSFFLYHFISYV